MLRAFVRTIICALLLATLPAAGIITGNTMMASESYIQILTGKLKPGDVCTVTDDKYANLSLQEWNQLHNITVDNLITFELRFDTPEHYYNQSFTCTLNVKVKYYVTKDEQTPNEFNNIKLIVKYDPATGPVAAIAQYKLMGAFKVEVTVNSITSPELGANIPDIFRLKNQIMIERKYPFNPQVNGPLTMQYEPESNPAKQQGAGKLNISWNPANYNNSEEYDVEWAFIDRYGDGANYVNLFDGDGFNADIPDAVVGEWMKYNSTRVTVSQPPYTISLPYPEGIVVMRVRGAYYQENTAVRTHTNWQYRMVNGKTAARLISGHEHELNWQFTGAFLEEGKRKETMSYFDATMRNRQNVSVSGSNQTLVPGGGGQRQATAIMDEQVFDYMGRAVLNFLPTPVLTKSLGFYRGLNRSVNSGNPYGTPDILDRFSNVYCAAGAYAANTTDGASRYYSPQNPFLNDPQFSFNAYIPDAGGYPFTLTQYLPDNTGRVRRQAAPGDELKMEKGRTLQYYYGKPQPKELDRLFGSEAGNASHFTKNMIIDPNGQVSVSYVNSTGKTVATALAGLPPARQSALNTSAESTGKVRLEQELIKTTDIRRIPAELKMEATATFLAAITGTYTVHYNIDPIALVTKYGPNQSLQLCHNCYYTVLVEVKDECGDVKASVTATPFLLNDVTCHTGLPPFKGTLDIPVNKVGEYTVFYSLQLNNEAIATLTDHYIANNTDLKRLQQFFMEELARLDLTGCYTTCEECRSLGSSPDAWREKVIALLNNGQFSGITVPGEVTDWINATWATLRANCNLLNCNAQNACEDYLERMKMDVRPGGQYALYGFYSANGSFENGFYAYQDRTVSILRLYNQPGFPDAEFVNELGETKNRAGLSESDFIRAYLDHPEWADDFVKYHIEYCSYLWCKDETFPNVPAKKNPESYDFDKTLREIVIDGDDAVARGFYSRSDMMALLKKDPFFYGGRGESLRTQMENDLNNFSNAIKAIAKDGAGNLLPGKNIFQFIDWILYCKPVSGNPTGQDIVNSWNNCGDPGTCRTPTKEWEMYRNFYLQLKSKYMQQVKALAQPQCTDCFIGQDNLSAAGCTPPGALSEYSIQLEVVNENTNVYLKHLPSGNNNPVFLDHYKVRYSYVLNGVTIQEIAIVYKGEPAYKLISTRLNNLASSFQVVSVECLLQNTAAPCSTAPSGPGPGGNIPCPQLGQFNLQSGPVIYQNSPPQYYYNYTEKTLVYNGGGTTPREVTFKITEETASPWLGSTYYTYDLVLPAGTGSIYLGNEYTQWNDDNLNGYQEDGEVVYGYIYITELICSNPPASCPPASEFSISKRHQITHLGPPCVYQEWSNYLVHTGGPVTKDVKVLVNYDEANGAHTASLVTMPAGQSEVYVSQTYKWFAGGSNCFANESFRSVGATTECETPVSTGCKDDPRAALYIGKTRIFNTYTDLDAYAACSGNSPEPVLTDAEIVNKLRPMAIEDLDALRPNWEERLMAVRDADPAFQAITDVMINQLVNALYAIALKHIEVNTDPNNVRPASSLPNGQTASPQYPYNNFSDAFNALIGASYIQQGYNAYLLSKPYPHDRAPVIENMSSGDLNAGICSNLQALRNRYNASGLTGSKTFHEYLAIELGDDYNLTAIQLADMEARCGALCRHLKDPVRLPVALSVLTPANPDHPFVNCARINSLQASFDIAFPQVNAQHPLYDITFTNYLNHHLGYALAFYEYSNFQQQCSTQPLAVLYNKPASPQVRQNDIACASRQIREAYRIAGEEYDRYIVIERRKFRDRYIIKCLENNATANLTGDLYEYHYTLYYYDQAGDLVKTIPPEGVRLLSKEETELVDDYRGFNPTNCTGAGVPPTETKAATLNAMSSNLQSGAIKGMEFWLYAGNGTDVRQVRMITPDMKYFYQAAIKDKKIWVELYSLLPDGSNGTTLSLSNRAVADIAAIPLQPWSHLVVQSAAFTGAPWEIYLDGHKLQLMALDDAPYYPFAWEIGENAALPAEELAEVKHVRMYNDMAVESEVLANYHNSCLSPEGRLAAAGTPLLHWGRFNVPAPGSGTTTGQGSTVEYVNRFIVPLHGMPTVYKYNSNHQRVSQTTPDAGTSSYWYDRLGRLVISQSAEQLQSSTGDADNRFSYTKFDALGRTTEVGEKTSSNLTITEADSRINSWLNNTFYSSGSNRNLTQTIFDTEPVDAPGSLFNLRNRVAGTIIKQSTAGPVEHGTYYSYDITGNIKKVYQRNERMTAVEPTNDDKLLWYDYDLISGKVNLLRYQEGRGDQFYYKYRYDADNRVVEVATSHDRVTWTTEATYRYYLHGPLARIELGNYKVQGQDYAYTLQGWPKGMNGSRIAAVQPDGSHLVSDISLDGKPGMPFSQVARDVAGFELGYFKNDYKPIQPADAHAFDLAYQFPPTPSGNPGDELFNGNITHAAYTIRNLEGGNPNVKGYTYRYDQLNRLVAAKHHIVAGTGNSWGTTDMSDILGESYSYDANGNIATAQRSGNQSGPAGVMDMQTYQYALDNEGRKVHNKLLRIADAAGAAQYTEDIDDQPAGNYTYDRNGNVLTDQAEHLNAVRWNVYGKITSVEKQFTDAQLNNRLITVNYDYDASGNRVRKKVVNKLLSNNTTTEEETFYTRDMAGNVIATYVNKNSTVPGSPQGLFWQEQTLYGLKRLGTWRPDKRIQEGVGAPQPGLRTVLIGDRNYELTNHLDNVVTVLSDKKKGVDNNGDGTIEYFEPETLGATDYYAFGMRMPGRSNGNYRHGFNGKENDDELNGPGTLQDYGLRMYDPRVGRFLSVDPLTASYAYYSPYQFAGNSPIKNIDLDGGEPKSTTQDALKVIDDFEKAKPDIKNMTYKSVSVAAFIENLRKRVKAPSELAQGEGTNFCGPAAVLSQILISNDPKGYAELMINLYRNGSAVYNNKTSKTIILTTATVRDAAGKLPNGSHFDDRPDLSLADNPVDQMLLLAVKYTYNSNLKIITDYGNFHMGDQEGLWASTTIGQFREMASDFLGYDVDKVGHNFNPFSPVGGMLIGSRLSKVNEYVAEGKTVFLFLNGHIFRSNPVIPAKHWVGTHFIRIHNISYSEDGNNVTLKFWEYGDTRTKTMPAAEFEKSVYGVITVSDKKD